MNTLKGFERGNPTRTFSKEVHDAIVEKCRVMASELRERKERAGCGELYEYLLPEGSRIVNGNVFVLQGVQLKYLGSLNEVLEKIIKGGI